MKIAPISRALRAHGGFEPILLHTGQHYDHEMSQAFFEDLGIPAPDVYLGIGSASHAVQTAQVMIAFEQVLVARKPDVVLVVGDINSTLACALTAAKLQVPVVHVEAGLRSYNRSMPEEINRVVVDALSDLLFTTEASATQNLLREGIPDTRIHFVGNVMIDTLLANLPRARDIDVLSRFGVQPRKYALLTLHRPSNVDDKETLTTLLSVVAKISAEIPVIFPLHPRTRQRMVESGISLPLSSEQRFQTSGPLGYLSFLSLMSQARFVLTDSGGIQEETTALGIPCLTLREETERPITVTHGTNQIVGVDPVRIRQEARRILEGQGKDGRIPEKWDGHAAERIVSALWHVFGTEQHCRP